MEKRYFILFLVLILTSFSCERHIAGFYASNFGIYGLRIEQLDLKEDSSFDYVGRGDIQHYSVQGKWHFVNGHVLLTPDTLQGKINYKIRETYFYKNGRLFGTSKKEYKEFINHIYHLADSLSLVINLPEKANLVSSNTMGKLKVYYLKRVNAANPK